MSKLRLCPPPRQSRPGFTLVELMIVVAIIGILASIAIPAFMKYIRRSKTVEATMNLRRLFDSTSSYFVTERSDSNGNVLSHQFPANQAWTPTQGGACSQTGQKFAPAASQWSTAAWQALNFGIDDPHYYSYETSGSGGASAVGSVYQLEATGDLNCNGTYSLFRRSATVAADYSVRGGSGIYTVNDIE